MALGGDSTPDRGSYSIVATSEDGRRRKMNVAKSPFFRPSDPRTLKRMSTPGGSVHLKKLEDEAEHKSTIFGASANMIVSIVGAGIVGVPYAIKESGLWAGIFMVVFCAVITEKSLRLLIETAKHVDVPSYEVLYEASFGRPGFIAMSLFMFSMSYGAMVSYMMIMKDTLSDLFGVEESDHYTRRAVLVATTWLVLFPLSAQRDMADLAKTSRISVFFYFVIVAFVIFNSPVPESVKVNGGWKLILSNDIIRPETFFTGLGVLSFAYVCQHSSFIIAGSLKQPTKQRWAQVTGNSLLFSGTLAILCGVFGYLGFLDDTDGNILSNFESLGDPLLVKLGNVVRFMLCFCMFFVYPMDAFVSRHVCVVLLFKGRLAHEGDDHAVLARRDRRITLTVGMIMVTMIPALLLRDLGIVLAITGSIAGSFLSYIGPGTAYLAVHGEEFLGIVKERWTRGFHVDRTNVADSGADVETTTQADNTGVPPPPTAPISNPVKDTLGSIFWFVLLMPIWIRVARNGQRNLEKHFEEEALKSPHPSRLGKVVHHNPPKARLKVASKVSRVLHPPKVSSGPSADNRTSPGLVRINSEPRTFETSRMALAPSNTDTPSIGYGAVSSENRSGTVDALHTKQREEANDEDSEDPAEDDPQDVLPNLYDFLVAIGFIVFGVVAMCVGLLSIFLQS